jgi:hypothetical protein
LRPCMIQSLHTAPRMHESTHDQEEHTCTLAVTRAGVGTQMHTQFYTQTHRYMHITMYHTTHTVAQVQPCKAEPRSFVHNSRRIATVTLKEWTYEGTGLRPESAHVYCGYTSLPVFLQLFQELLLVSIQQLTWPPQLQRAPAYVLISAVITHTHDGPRDCRTPLEVNHFLHRHESTAVACIFLVHPCLALQYPLHSPCPAMALSGIRWFGLLCGEAGRRAHPHTCPLTPLLCPECCMTSSLGLGLSPWPPLRLRSALARLAMSALGPVAGGAVGVPEGSIRQIITTLSSPPLASTP